jgi:hypothetical protein
MARGKAGGVPGNPGTTPKDELRERVEFTVFLLNRGLRKHAIKAQLAKRYGVSARTCERYLRAARKLIRKESGKTLSRHRLEALWFYESVVSGPDATLRERMAAQWRIVRLLGLDAPQRVRHGGDPHSPPIMTREAKEVDYTRLTPEEARLVEGLMRQVEQRSRLPEPSGN